MLLKYIVVVLVAYWIYIMCCISTAPLGCMFFATKTETLWEISSCFPHKLNKQEQDAAELKIKFIYLLYLYLFIKLGLIMLLSIVVEKEIQFLILATRWWQKTLLS